MEINEIIKDALEFPSKDLGTLSICIVLTILSGTLASGGMFSILLGRFSPVSILVGIVYFVMSLLIGFIILGYGISVIKSGIELNDKNPEIDWKEHFNIGYNNFIISFVYLIIPAVIVAIVALITNIFGNMAAVVKYMVSQLNQTVVMNNPSVLANIMNSQPVINLMISSIITMLIAFIVYLIFYFLLNIAQARFANTGDLNDALNIPETLKDIRKIGVKKVIALFLLIIVIALIVEFVLGSIYNVLPVLSVASIIVTPYIMLFMQRAIGLLYSDIA